MNHLNSVAYNDFRITLMLFQRRRPHAPLGLLFNKTSEQEHGRLFKNPPPGVIRKLRLHIEVVPLLSNCSWDLHLLRLKSHTWTLQIRAGSEFYSKITSTCPVRIDCPVHIEQDRSGTDLLGPVRSGTPITPSNRTAPLRQDYLKELVVGISINTTSGSSAHRRGLVDLSNQCPGCCCSCCTLCFLIRLVFEKEHVSHTKFHICCDKWRR